MIARSGFASLATAEAAATATPRLPTRSSASLPTQVLIWCNIMLSMVYFVLVGSLLILKVTTYAHKLNRGSVALR
jgi:hypothetical protein